MDTSTFFTKRNIIALIILAVLLIAVPIGVYLAQNTQIFRPQAAGGTAGFTFVQGSGVTCTGDNCTTTTDTIQLQLTSPFGPPAQ